MRSRPVQKSSFPQWGRRLGLIAILLGATACEGEGGSLMILAASSLTDAFDALAAQFGAEPTATAVSVGYAGSQVVRLQIEHGAVADVVAVADLAALDELAAREVVRDVSCLAQNELVVAVSGDDQASLRGLADLPKAQRLVIGAEGTPIGRYTREVFRRAEARWPGFQGRLHIVSEEPNVRLVLSKIALGEADAAIVYQTDIDGVRGLRSVPIARELQPLVRYGIGLVAESERLDAARDFLALATSPQGTATLRDHGFAAHACR